MSEDRPLGGDFEDTAPGDESPNRAEAIKGIRGYFVGAALAATLTIASFYLATHMLVWQPALGVALAALAIAQMGVHLVFFLHITSGPDNVNNALALAFGLLVVFLIMAGSLWIMAHLNGNMLPLNRVLSMQR